MRFKLEIDMDNEAFHSAGEIPELDECFKRILHTMETNDFGFVLGSNGNRVGKWEIT